MSKLHKLFLKKILLHVFPERVKCKYIFNFYHFLSFQNQVPCPLPTITTEDVDRTVSPNHQSPPQEEEVTTPPPRTRMRSLSGGAYRLAPTLPSTGRHRRQSGDDVLTRVSPSRRATLFDQFRPRSKSDSKGKKPTFLTTLKNSILGGSAQRKLSLESDPPTIEPLQPSIDYKQRPRSGSETKSGTMSKVIDIFRNRSHSVSYDSKGKVSRHLIILFSSIKYVFTLQGSQWRLKSDYLLLTSVIGYYGDYFSH